MKGKLVIGVCVVGKLNLDLILFPRPATPCLATVARAGEKGIRPGNSLGDFCRQFGWARGTQVGFVSKIEDDPLGKMALERLSAVGVDTAGVKQEASSGARWDGDRFLGRIEVHES